jgi:hypothetical protein
LIGVPLSWEVWTYPNGHADAARNLHARASHAVVSIRKLLELLGVRRGAHADINLGVGDIDTEVSGDTQSLDEVLLRRSRGGLSRGGLGDKVSLIADTVDASAVLLDKAHDAGSTLNLGSEILEVVVIVVELGRGIGLGGHPESNRDIRLSDLQSHGHQPGSLKTTGLGIGLGFLSYHSEENIVTVGAILVQRFAKMSANVTLISGR